jgi:SAM-dependent methyltransferase
MKKEWFATWFDSPYYHILYQNRDEREAQASIDNFMLAMQVPKGSRILDLACGKGRHARYLAERGFDVTGLDISFASIAFARQFEHERLAFYQHDMRLPYRFNYYDAILNIFTSFGYFATDEEHEKTLKNVVRGLKPGGLFLLDFFNAQWVQQNIVRQAEKKADNITFQLKKRIRGPFIYKTVEFETGGRLFYFQERVRLFTLSDLENMFTRTGLRLRQTFGGYDLSPFDAAKSARLILIAEKV